MFNRYGKFIENSDIPYSKRVTHVDSSNVNASDNYYPAVNENVLEVDSSDIGANCGIYLPDPGECPGFMFEVYSPDVGTATNKIEVFDESDTQLGNDLDADDNYIVVLSTGMNWRTIANSS